MLRSIDDLKACRLHATDGDIGRVEEVYFDDEAWGIRYIVVDTGGWLTGRDVLVSPMSVRRADFGKRVIELALTRGQVENSPEIDTHKPVSRRQERDFLGYYGYAPYWGGPLLWGFGALPFAYESAQTRPITPQEREIEAAAEEQQQQDAHLRSSAEVAGYDIRATDESIGSVDDFLFDDETWAIRYLVVDTSSWWSGGRKVMIGTAWVEAIDWPGRCVRVKMTREQVRHSPDYDPAAVPTRDYEELLHRHFGATGYWE